MQKIRFATISVPYAMFMRKNIIPKEIAIQATIFTNLDISLDIRVSPPSADYARVAICPITV